ncbi:MAG TPA: SMP-30/gluconolactonase/LRE family protein [Devosia sp.]|nr:SMP-30/gluconolactonase/LRE family protein [Devosia sp.]
MTSKQQIEIRDDEQGATSVSGTQALRKGISLLELIATRPMRFTDLASVAGLPKGTLHRILGTLVETGLLRLDRSTQTYRLGVRLFEMAHHVWDEFDLRGAAEPELERLAEKTGESVRLAILDHGEALYIDERASARTIRLVSGVGGRVAPHASGVGKAILAHLAPAERMEFIAGLKLERFTPNTITEADALIRELDLIKGRGYSISIEEQTPGVSSVAAAILDHRARSIGAIGIVAPSFRMTADDLHALGREVIEASRRISGNAGEAAMSLQVQKKPLGADRPDVRVAVVGSAFLAEGPCWSAAQQKLYWVDILAPAILQSDLKRGVAVSRPMPELVSALVPRHRGGFVATTQHGIKALDIETGSMTPIANPEASKPGNRFNDARCDRRGRLWAGTLAIDTTPGEGSLYRLDPDGQIHRMDTGFHVSNGLDFSPDNRRLYFTDTGKRRIYVYDFDLESGEIDNRRVFHELPEGIGTPNGLTVDSEGYVWSAQWDGWCVTRYDPDGEVERVVNLPVPRPTSCVFGGPDLTTLLVTSARIRLSAQQLAEAPLSGSVFAVETGIRGMPDTPFAG